MVVQEQEVANNQTGAEMRNEIIIKDLVRQFGDITAVNGLNLEIRKVKE